MASGRRALIRLPATLPVADGAAWTPLTWTAPTEPLAVLPPPAWTAPTEFEAVLFPDPETETGTETPALTPPTEAPADGAAVVFPTWTVPIDPVAPLSASAAGAAIAATRSAGAKTVRNRILLPPFLLSLPQLSLGDNSRFLLDLRRITRRRDAPETPSGAGSTLLVPLRPTDTLGGAAWRARS